MVWELTTTWFGPLPWTSQSIPIGPPRVFATWRWPRDVGVRFQITSLNAGCFWSSDAFRLDLGFVLEVFHVRLGRLFN